MTDEHFQEEDYRVVQVNEGRRPGGIVSVRLKPEEMGLLTAMAEESGRSLSETLRTALQCLAKTPSHPRFESGPTTRGTWHDLAIAAKAPGDRSRVHYRTQLTGTTLVQPPFVAGTSTARTSSYTKRSA